MKDNKDQFSIREPQYLETFKPFRSTVSFDHISAFLEDYARKAGRQLNVLDSMAGIGAVGRKIREMIYGLNIIFQDKSLKMLHAEAYSKEDVRIQCDSADLCFPDRSFDAVICRAGLNNVGKAKYPKVLREFMRVLRTGGIGILQDHFAPTAEAKETINRLEKEVARMEGKIDQDYVPTVEELKELIRSAGGRVTGEVAFEMPFSMKERFAAKGITAPDIPTIVEILKGQDALKYEETEGDVRVTYPGITVVFSKDAAWFCPHPPICYNK